MSQLKVSIVWTDTRHYDILQTGRINTDTSLLKSPQKVREFTFTEGEQYVCDRLIDLLTSLRDAIVYTVNETKQTLKCQV